LSTRASTLWANTANTSHGFKDLAAASISLTRKAIKTMENLEIKNLQDCAAFIFWISVEKGCIYHPDTPASEYVFSGTGGVPVFTPFDAEWVQRKIDAANGLCESIGMDPSDLAYEVCSEIGACHKIDPIMRALPAVDEDGDDIEVEEVSFARAMRLHHRGLLVYWVDGDGHESLCHSVETIIDRAAIGAWFYTE
jgi:hypothetical protein